MATKTPQSLGTTSPRPRRAPKTIKSLVEEFLIDHQSQNHSPQTLEWHRTALGYLIRYLEEQGSIDSGESELTFGQLDFRSGVLLAHGKGDKERRIALGSNALLKLRRYLDHGRKEFRACDDSDRLFLGEVGPLTPRGISQIILRAKLRSGLTDKRISPHIFRHTFAVRYLILGGDPFSLQELLGHEDMKTIKNYMHMNDVHIQMQKRRFSPGDHVTFSAKPRRRSDFRNV